MFSWLNLAAERLCKLDLIRHFGLLERKIALSACCAIAKLESFCDVAINRTTVGEITPRPSPATRQWLRDRWMTCLVWALNIRRAVKCPSIPTGPHPPRLNSAGRSGSSATSDPWPPDFLPSSPSLRPSPWCCCPDSASSHCALNSSISVQLNVKVRLNLIHFREIMENQLKITRLFIHLISPTCTSIDSSCYALSIIFWV